MVSLFFFFFLWLLLWWRWWWSWLTGGGEEWHAARAVSHTGARWQGDDDDSSSQRGAGAAGRRKEGFSQLAHLPNSISDIDSYDNWVISEGPEAEIGASMHTSDSPDPMYVVSAKVVIVSLFHRSGSCRGGAADAGASSAARPRRAVEAHAFPPLYGSVA